MEKDLSVVDWSAGIYFIEISVNGTLTGTTQLLSVPYALYAEKTGIRSKDGDVVYYNNGSVGIGNTNPKERLVVHGAITVGDGGYPGITDGATTPVPAGGAGLLYF